MMGCFMHNKKSMPIGAAWESFKIPSDYYESYF